MLFVFFTSTPPLITALGTNCKGSSLCASVDDIIEKLNEAMERNLQAGINGWYRPGQHIACANGAGMRSGPYCAFWQHGWSGDLAQAHGALQAIRATGCKSCGSAAMNLETNNVKDGELTVNTIAGARNTCQADCRSTALVDPIYYVCMERPWENVNGKGESECEKNEGLGYTAVSNYVGDEHYGPTAGGG
ncbi:MAG: hypothetical protein Q9162_003467 [Coniocarpon cinnabarinum]